MQIACMMGLDAVISYLQFLFYTVELLNVIQLQFQTGRLAAQHPHCTAAIYRRGPHSTLTAKQRAQFAA